MIINRVILISHGAYCVRPVGAGNSERCLPRPKKYHGSVMPMSKVGNGVIFNESTTRFFMAATNCIV